MTNFFARLSVTKSILRKCANKVDVSVYGFDDDPRELWEIEEVKSWFQTVEPLVKYWFYFLKTEDGFGGLKTLAACICDAQRVSIHGSKIQVEMDSLQLSEFIERNFFWLNEMTERLSLPIEKNKEISLNVIRCFFPGYSEDADSE